MRKVPGFVEVGELEAAGNMGYPDMDDTCQICGSYNNAFVYCDECVKELTLALEALKKIRQLLPDDPDSALDDRIRHIEKNGDPDGLTPDDVCGIMEKLYVEQWDAIYKIVSAIGG